jgi:hypothetical protein
METESERERERERQIPPVCKGVDRRPMPEAPTNTE